MINFPLVPLALLNEEKHLFQTELKSRHNEAHFLWSSLQFVIRSTVPKREDETRSGWNLFLAIDSFSHVVSVVLIISLDVIMLSWSSDSIEKAELRQGFSQKTNERLHFFLLWRVDTKWSQTLFVRFFSI